MSVNEDVLYTQDNVDNGYIYSLHILEINVSFPIFATSGRQVHSHIPHGVIHKNKDYEAYFTIQDACKGKSKGSTTYPFTFSKN